MPNNQGRRGLPPRRRRDHNELRDTLDQLQLPTAWACRPHHVKPRSLEGATWDMILIGLGRGRRLEDQSKKPFLIYLESSL
jgi:hypothetical protein